MSDPAVITADSVPRLPRGVRLRFDEARNNWTLLAPERVLKLDEIAAEILRRVDGEASVAAIVEDLVKAYQADPDQVSRDVTELLQTIADKRMLEA
ncbi:MAG: pyrroloquinoline quinone biosynthesis peptide chaperone PqqD [Alphaproteobacteria bacterium]|nr:pyrroloquinoline quinone biosynthesis peptide chaperone PqqD [Alphaproteobacteria bacterium]